MKQIPFYANTEDNNRCMVAIYRMLFDYYLNRKLSQEEMEDFVGYTEGRAAWTLKPITAMVRMGFDIRMIEPFDYQEFVRQGSDYIHRAFSEDKAHWMLTHSNILDIAADVPDFLQMVKPEMRQARLADIDAMLREDMMVFVTLNGRALNNKPGYSEHCVLVIQREGEHYIVHDPGLPPKRYRKVTRHLLWQAMGGDENTSEVTGFIYRKAHNMRRLDQYVITKMPRLSRAYAAKLIEQGKVLVNGKTRKPGYKVREEDVVAIDYNEQELDTIPAIDLPILYEDNDCIVINKPAGVLTHSQGALTPEGTVATFLRSRVTGMEGERAGIVHRLDRATSGVLICAKNPAALSFLQQQFAARTAKKTYMAIVSGHFKQPKAVVSMPIERNPKAPATFRVGVNGKPATTVYKVAQESPRASLVELKPETGRTHQLRVHMAELGHPIIGDPLYGSGSFGDRLYLHAMSLSVTLPNGESKTFTAPLPHEFEEYLSS